MEASTKKKIELVLTGIGGILLAHGIRHFSDFSPFWALVIVAPIFIYNVSELAKLGEIERENKPD